MDVTRLEFPNFILLLSVCRLIEEVKELCDVTMANDDIYMQPG